MLHTHFHLQHMLLLPGQDGDAWEPSKMCNSLSNVGNHWIEKYYHIGVSKSLSWHTTVKNSLTLLHTVHEAASTTKLIRPFQQQCPPHSCPPSPSVPHRSTSAARLTVFTLPKWLQKDHMSLMNTDPTRSRPSEITIYETKRTSQAEHNLSR